MKKSLTRTQCTARRFPLYQAVLSLLAGLLIAALAPALRAAEPAPSAVRLLGFYATATVQHTAGQPAVISGDIWLRLRNRSEQALTAVPVLVDPAIRVSAARDAAKHQLRRVAQRRGAAKQVTIALADPIEPRATTEVVLSFKGRLPGADTATMPLTLNRSQFALPLPVAAARGQQAEPFAQSFTLTLTPDLSPIVAAPFEIRQKRLVAGGTAYTINHSHTGHDFALMIAAIGSAPAGR